MPILDWLGREEDVKQAEAVPYRLLEAAPDHAYGDGDAGNMLIQGDNLEALKALLPYYTGQVKCIFIDPPYNTRRAFEHYDDNLEHSKWLSMMYPRLELLRELLAEDGSIWVTIDDNEAHYLKVIMDEIFGRKNFIANCIWQKKYTRQNDARFFSDNHAHVFCFCKNIKSFKINRLPRTEKMDSRYKNPDADPRGPWTSHALQVKTPNESYIYEITNPAGETFYPPRGTSWMCSKDRYEKLVADNRIWFGKNGSNVPRRKKFLSEINRGLVPVTIWHPSEVGHNQGAKTELRKLLDKSFFDTPKPEKLLKHILYITTNKNDLVLDSFLGSGTTAAVAHKMGRQYIGIEMGEHIETHCIPRLKKVIDGEQGGISEDTGWEGGGGFLYYRLSSRFYPDTTA